MPAFRTEVRVPVRRNIRRCFPAPARFDDFRAGTVQAVRLVVVFRGSHWAARGTERSFFVAKTLPSSYM
jgi:hypothetical protein